MASPVIIELRDMQWAVVASRHRSLRSAAEALNVRQSTLSRRLRDLEQRLTARLFERTNGGTRPTPEGQEFLESAKHILGETEALATRVKTRSRGESGRLAIGVQCSLSAGNLRATLIEHRRRFPGVQTYLVDGSSDHLACDLAGANIDVAFIIEENSHWDGASLPVWSERVVVALPESHALAGREFIHWTDLPGEVVLVPQRGPGAELLKMLVSKVGNTDSCQVQHHDVSLDRLLTMVGAAMGVLLMFEGATGFSYSGVVFRELHDGNGPTRRGFHAIWRRENSNPSLVLFLAMLRERYPDLSAAPPDV